MAFELLLQIYKYLIFKIPDINLQPATCNLQLATCNLQLATCNLQLKPDTRYLY